MIKYLLLLLVTLSCSHPVKQAPLEKLTSIHSPADWHLFVGRWYGKGEDKAGFPYQWIIDRKEDGTHSITYQYLVSDKKIVEETYLGHWGAYQSYYFTSAHHMKLKGKIVPIPREQLPRDVAYGIIEITKDKLVFQDSLDYTIFSTIKVGDDYRFPKLRVE